MGSQKYICYFFLLRLWNITKAWKFVGKSIMAWKAFRPESIAFGPDHLTAVTRGIEWIDGAYQDIDVVLREKSFDQVTAYVPTFGNGRAKTSSISHSVFNSSLRLKKIWYCSWSAEQGKKKKKKTGGAPPLPPSALLVRRKKKKRRDASSCLGATQVGVTQVVSVRLASVQRFLRLVS